MNDASRAAASALRVLVVFSGRGLGGAERSLTRMALASGGAVTYRLVTIGGEGDWSRWARQQGASVGVFDASSPWRAARAAFECIRDARAFRPDIIYAVGLRSSLLLRAHNWRRSSVLLVHAIRSTFPPGSRMRRKYGIVERLLRRSTAHYIANSEAGALGTRELTGAGADRVSVIYNGLAGMTPIDSPAASRPERVVVVANITGDKGHVEFLDVLRRLHAKRPGLQVHFVGRNDLGTTLVREIERYGLQNVVSVNGFSATPEVAMRSARVLALPTLKVEGCPTAIMEAMTLGLPVVAYAVGGIPELIANGVNGILVAPGDEQGFCEALDALLGDEALNARIAAAAQQTARERFSLQRCAEQHAELWNRLLRRPTVTG